MPWPPKWQRRRAAAEGAPPTTQSMKGPSMRFVFRILVLALAAIGAKFVYDTFMMRREEFRNTADTLLNRTSSAAQEMRASVTEAATNIASTVQSAASDASQAPDATSAPAGDPRQV